MANLTSNPYRNIKSIHTFKARMDGNQEFPSAVDTKAFGECCLIYNSKSREMLYYIDYKGLTSNETASHFHAGGSKQAGEIIIGIPVGNPKMGSIILTEEQEELLFLGKLFFNIHSEQYPNGEIRGQIFPTSEAENNEYLSVIYAKKKKTKKSKKKWKAVYNDIKDLTQELITETVQKMEKVEDVFEDSHIMGLQAKILKTTKLGSIETMEVMLGSDDDPYPRHMMFEVSYDGNGGFSSVRMWDSYIPAKHIADLVSFLKSLGK